MGTLNIRCRIIRDPKRDLDFDNHPCLLVVYTKAKDPYGFRVEGFLNLTTV